MGLDLNDLNVDLHKLGDSRGPQNHPKLVFGASFPEIFSSTNPFEFHILVIPQVWGIYTIFLAIGWNWVAYFQRKQWCCSAGAKALSALEVATSRYRVGCLSEMTRQCARSST